jgi:hypothetical protein
MVQVWREKERRGLPDFGGSGQSEQEGMWE